MKQNTYVVTYKSFSGTTEQIKVRSTNPEQAKSLAYDQVEDCACPINATKC